MCITTLFLASFVSRHTIVRKLKEIEIEKIDSAIEKIVKDEEHNILVDASREADIKSNMEQLRYEAVLNKNKIELI